MTSLHTPPLVGGDVGMSEHGQESGALRLRGG